jgi:hypothetical protein
MADENNSHAHRHAYQAYEDFRRLRKRPADEKLWHALSHHLRHVVYRTGREVGAHQRRYVRRHHRG